MLTNDETCIQNVRDYIVYIYGLYLINLFELHLIDNHIVQRKLPSFRQLDKLRHFGFGLYNWTPVGQKGVQT